MEVCGRPTPITDAVLRATDSSSFKLEFDICTLIDHTCMYLHTDVHWESMSESHTTVFNWEFCLCMCMYGPNILNVFSPRACTLFATIWGIKFVSNYVLSMSDVASRMAAFSCHW